ncbi:MAG: type II toxin-antitoxin system Phd/YefM family antitoxin [Janthinobacterium lividum]
MPDTTQHPQPLDALRDNPGAILEQLKTGGGPMIFTVDGKPEAVLQDAAAYQRLLDLAALADEDEALRQGDEDIHAGRTRPAREIFDEMRQRYAIPR